MIGTTAAILGSAAIGAGTSIISGKQQSKAAKAGAQAYSDAADQSAAVQREMFQTVWNAGANQRAIADQALSMLGRSFGIQIPASATQPTTTTPASQSTMQIDYDALNERLSSTPRPIHGQQPHADGAAPGLFVNPTLGGGGFFMPTGGSGGTQTTNGEPQGSPVPPNTSQPQTGTGAGANPPANALDPYADFIASPDYQFRLDQGLRGGRNALASQGMLNSGAAVKALADYQGGMALGEFNNWRSGLGALAGYGSQAFATGANAAGNYANALTGINMNNAAAQASSYQNRANANTNALGGAMGSILWGLGKFG